MTVKDFRFEISRSFVSKTLIKKCRQKSSKSQSQTEVP